MNSYPIYDKDADGEVGIFEEALVEKLLTTFTGRVDESPLQTLGHVDKKQIAQGSAYLVFPRGALIPFAGTPLEKDDPIPHGIMAGYDP